MDDILTVIDDEAEADQSIGGLPNDRPVTKARADGLPLRRMAGTADSQDRLRGSAESTLICPGQSSRTRLSTLSCSSASAGKDQSGKAVVDLDDLRTAWRNRSTRSRSTSTLADRGSGSTAPWSRGG